MKKMFFKVLVIGLFSIVVPGATLSANPILQPIINELNGQPVGAVSEITINPSDTISFDLELMPDGSVDQFLGMDVIVSITGPATLDISEYTLPDGWDPSFHHDPIEIEAGKSYELLEGNFNFGPIGIQLENIKLTCNGGGDVTIQLSKGSFAGGSVLEDYTKPTWGSAVVHQNAGLGDTIAPTAGGSVADITTAGGATHNFTVTYSDNVAVDVSSLDGADVLVIGPSSYSQAASFVSVDVASDGTPRVATYQITAPGGSWDETDNGTYTVTMQTDQVSDTAATANFVAGASLGTFEVNISGTPADTTAPTAGGSVADITTAGGTTHSFTVTYSDNVAVDVSSLDGADVLVTGPSSYSQAASFVSVDVASDGTPRVATYQITAPGGS